MTLHEFIKEQKRLLEKFEDWYSKNNQDNPEFFPMTMQDGDWDEQLRFFSDEEE